MLALEIKGVGSAEIDIGGAGVEKVFMPTPSSKLGREIENVLYWVQLEQLGASAVRSPLPTDCRCRRPPVRSQAL